MKNNTRTYLTTKRKLFYLLFSLIIVISSILIVSCNNSGEPSGSPMETLDAPTNINIDKRIVTWDAVENASGYIVSFANVEYETAEPTFSLRFHGTSGTYKIKVKAVGDVQNFENSEWSKATTFNLGERVTDGYDKTGFYYTLLEDKSGYEVNRGKRNDISGVVTIPDYFGDYPVKRINRDVFEYKAFNSSSKKDYFTGVGCNKTTTGIKLPAYLESIYSSTFMGLVGLEEIVIPDSVTEIGTAAFMGCTNLKRVVLPNDLKIIPQNCFADTALAEINLPDGLEKIEFSAFRCAYENEHHIYSELSSISFPSSVKYIGKSAFYGREKLENIIVPSTVDFIYNYAFDATKWYENQPNEAMFIGEGNCFLYGFKGEIPSVIIDDFPANVKGICGAAFSQSNLKK